MAGSGWEEGSGPQVAGGGPLSRAVVTWEGCGWVSVSCDRRWAKGSAPSPEDTATGPFSGWLGNCGRTGGQEGGGRVLGGVLAAVWQVSPGKPCVVVHTPAGQAGNGSAPAGGSWRGLGSQGRQAWAPLLALPPVPCTS